MPGSQTHRPCPASAAHRCAGPRADAGHRGRHRLRRDHPLRQRGARAAPRRPDRRAARRSSSATSCTPRTASAAVPAWQRARGAASATGSSWRCASARPTPAGAGAWAASASIASSACTIGTYQETTALRDAEERFQRAFEDAAHRHGHHRHRRALRARQPLAGGDARPRAAASWPGWRCATSPTPPTTRTTARRCARSRPASRTPTAPRSATCAPTAARRGSPSTSPSCATPTAGRSTSSRRWPTSASAAPPSTRWPRARSASARWPSASPVGVFAIAEDGRLAYANERLREIFDMPAEVLDGTPWLERVPAEDRDAPRRRVPPRAGAGRRASRSTCASWPASTAGRASTWHRSRRAAGQPMGLVGTIEDVTVEVDGAHGPGRARGRVPDARRALHRLPLAPHARRHLPLRVARVAGACSAGTPRRCSAGRPSSSGMDHPDDMEIIERNWVEALREERPRTAAYRARRRDGSIVWLETTFARRARPRRRGARDGLRLARHLRAQERRARARPPRAARRAHRPAQPHAVPRPPRPGAAALAPARPRRGRRLPRPRPLQVVNDSLATRPATACSSTWPCG